MIRNAVFGISMLALSTSAFAATSHQHTSKARVVAAADAPAGDTAAPAGDKADKKVKKSTKKEKAPKGEKTEGAKEMKAPAPTPAK
jgi:hypothetical protein